MYPTYPLHKEYMIAPFMKKTKKGIGKKKALPKGRANFCNGKFLEHLFNNQRTSGTEQVIMCTYLLVKFNAYAIQNTY